MRIAAFHKPRVAVLAVGPKPGGTQIDGRDPVTLRTTEDVIIVSIPDGQPGSAWYRFKVYVRTDD